MPYRLLIRLVIALVIGLQVIHVVDGQVATQRGQTIAPAFEGWQKNPDGSFDLLFGYFNRNLEEELIVPIGANNSIAPLGPDAGQPTYFYPRRNMFVFRVRVPADWGEKDVVWTLTVNGKTEKAFGSLQPIYEIDRELMIKNQGRARANLNIVNDNRPPAVDVKVRSTASVNQKLSLSAVVTDDGHPALLPGARSRSAPFSNVPSRELPPPARSGLSVMWIQYRGPASAQIQPRGYQPATDGAPLAASVTFPMPGTYMLRAVASDSLLETARDVSIAVAPPVPAVLNR